MPKIALIFNTVCLWLGLVALLRICQLFFGRGDKRAHAWTTVLFLSFPAAFFLHQFYTEALFIALGFWAYYFALKRRWAVACVCLAFLTATRVTSVLFIGLVGMEYWRAYGWSVKKAVWNPKILWFLITPLGFLAYSIYLRIAMGDFLGMFHAYRYSWQYQKFNPHVWVIAHSSLEITYRCTVSHFAGCSTDLFVNNILPLAVMAVLIGLSILAIVYLRGRYVPLGLLGIASWLMFSLNGNWVSVYRYALPVATLYLVTVGLWKKLRLPFWLLFPVVQLCFALQMLLLCLYINGYFAG